MIPEGGAVVGVMVTDGVMVRFGKLVRGGSTLDDERWDVEFVEAVELRFPAVRVAPPGSDERGGGRMEILLWLLLFDDERCDVVEVGEEMLMLLLLELRDKLEEFRLLLLLFVVALKK